MSLIWLVLPSFKRLSIECFLYFLVFILLILNFFTVAIFHIASFFTFSLLGLWNLILFNIFSS